MNRIIHDGDDIVHPNDIPIRFDHPIAKLMIQLPLGLSDTVVNRLIAILRMNVTLPKTLLIPLFNWVSQ